MRKISIPESAVELLRQEHEKHPENPWMFPSPRTGEMYHPDSIAKLYEKILKDTGLEHIRFHDLRHPYVKHTTKKFNSEKQKTQATKIVDLIAWVFCFCIVSYSKRSWTL